MLAIGNGDGPGTGTFDCAIQACASNTTGCTPRWESIRTKRHSPNQKTSTNWSRCRGIPKLLGWGEIGLDYFYDHSPRDVQQRVFVQQMELAKTAKLPIIIHCRPSDNSENAWDDLLRLIREHWAATGLGGVMHCFTGTVETCAGWRSISDSSFRLPVTLPIRRHRTSAMPPAWFRWIRCSSRPTRRTWRRFLTAANAMSRHSSWRSHDRSAELRGVSLKKLAGKRRENFYRFFHIKQVC